MSRDDHFPPSRIDACREEFRALVAAYRDVVAAASKASGASLTRVDAALAGFEPGFFNNLLVSLDARFPGRPHDGGPLDELGLLAHALAARGGVLAAADATGYDPSRAVLRIEPGDRIALNADDFEAIAAAFLAALAAGPAA